MEKIENREQINTKKYWNLAHKSQYPFSGFDFYSNLLYSYIPLLEILYNDIKILDSTKYWLDFGCGNTDRNKLINLKKYKYIGYDISDYIINKNKVNDPDKLYISNLSELKKIKYELITSLHVFEHLDDPKKQFNILYELSNRYISIQVPFKDSYNSCLEHIWKFDENSFKVSDNEPIIIIGPNMNLEGDREIFYFWDKENKREKRLILEPYKYGYSGQGRFLFYQRNGFVEYYNTFLIFILSKLFGRKTLLKIKKKLFKSNNL